VSAAGAALRAQAARSLLAVLGEGRSLKVVLAKALPGIADTRDRALLEAICFAALRHRRRYEFALEAWMDRPLRDRDDNVHCLLLCGLAQLDALGLDAHAAVGATAEAARELDRPNHVGLVNAVLRRATREPLPASPDPAVALSYPDWLVERLRRDWPDEVIAVLEAGNLPAPLWLAINPRRGDRDTYAARLRDEMGIDTLAPAAPALGLRIEGRGSPESLPGWDEGACWVQDGSAQLAVEALDAASGARVLDACAAPGGKTAQLAARRDGDGTVLAVDVNARRLRRVGESLQRLGLASPAVRLLAVDAGDPEALGEEAPFDAILLDAPCSATGIIRRQPDIKWHRREDDIAALVQQQSRLLDGLWLRLAPGGRLLYATCSILREENQAQVAAFLARTPDARAAPLDERFGRPAGAGRQRLPGEDGMDGFFYAVLVKAPAPDHA
jgi:16S rRNA (cytosine967-C5)-methyltransferase